MANNEKENLKEFKENVATVQKSEMGFDDDFDHPYHITFDMEGNIIHDGHAALHSDPIKK